MRMADQRRMRRRSRAFVEQSLQAADGAAEEEGFDSLDHSTLLQQKHNFHHGDTEARRKIGAVRYIA